MLTKKVGVKLIILSSITGSTLIQSATSSKSAFILPYYLSKGNNNIYYVFGKESGGQNRGTYSPFGGKSNPGENFYQTAAREFREETHAPSIMGYNDHAIQNRIHKNSYYQHKGHNFALYVTKFPQSRMKSLLCKFRGSPEISQVAEVRADRLRNALNSGKSTVEATVWYNGKSQGQHQITLRPLTKKLKGHI